jgi:hypothetical protein
MRARNEKARIEVILPDEDGTDARLTEASVLRLARLIGRQMAREEFERRKPRRRRRQK